MKAKILKRTFMLLLTLIASINILSSADYSVAQASSNYWVIKHETFHQNKKHLVKLIQDANIGKNLSYKVYVQGHRGEIYDSSKTVTVKFKNHRPVNFTYLNGVGYVMSIFVENYTSQPTLETAFSENLITTPQEVANTPWEKYTNGQDMIEPLANGRDIYYRIDSTGNMRDIWQKAIDGWNNLGVVQFIPTNVEDSQHVLTLTNSNETQAPDYSKPWEGLTYPNSKRESNNSLVYNACYLSNERMSSNNESYYQKVCVAEHELGHVLGLDHDTRLYSEDKKPIQALMNPYAEDSKASFDYLALSAGAKEQHVLMNKYNLSILTGYFEYPELNLDTTNDNNHIQLAANVPNRNTNYNYQTNQFTN